MKIAAILLAGAVMTSPVLAQAQTATSPGADKPVHGDVVRVPRASAAMPARSANDTDRVIDDELRRIDHMMTICTGC